MNKEKQKRACYVAGECCGKLAKGFTALAIITFVVGAIFELHWDHIERKEYKKRNK